MRNGITPTSANSLLDRDRVVNWAHREDLQVSQNGLVGVRQRSAQETAKGDRVIQQAQGWVVTSDGRVWLTANNPHVTMQNAGIHHPDCHDRPSGKAGGRGQEAGG